MVDVELKKRGVYLGKTGETGRYRVWLDVSAWDEEYEGGVGLLLYTDPKGNTAPMRTVKEFDGEKTKLYGYVTAEETKEAGTGVIEARWENAGVVAKSDHFNTVVMASSYTGKNIGDNTPDWVRDLMTELNAVNVVLDEAAQVAEDVAAIRETIEGAETVAKAAALDSEAWAVGERDGEDVDEDDPTYGNNARKYAQDAGGSAAAAGVYKQEAEAWAKGTKNGQAVPSTDPAYQKNAKYYAEQAFSGTPEGYADLVGDVGDLKSAVVNEQKGTTAITGDMIIQGSYGSAGGVSPNNARIRTAGFIAVYSGEQIRFTSGTNAQQMFYGKFDASKHFISDGSWLNTGNLDINWDGYIILVFRKTSNADILPSEYDATTEFVSKSYKEYQGLIDNVGNDFTKANDKLMALANGLDITYTVGGTGYKIVECLLIDGSTYVFTNNMSAGCNLQLYKEDGTTETLTSVVNSGAQYYFTISGDDYIGIRFYANATGSVTISGGMSLESLNDNDSAIIEKYNTVTNFANDGIETFLTHGTFEIGGLLQNGSLLPTQKTRVSNTDIMKFTRDITVKVKNGFRWGYIPFEGTTPGSWSGWITSDYTIPAGTSFIVQISKATEGTATADINEYVSAVPFASKIAETIERDIRVGDVTYFGELVPSRKGSFDWQKIFTMGSESGITSQDIDVYGNYLFVAFSGTEKIRVYSLTDYSLVASVSATVNHGSQMQFSDEFYASGDQFPLLYVGGYTDNIINVLRITITDNVWSATVVKQLYIPTTNGYYFAPTLDNYNHVLYCFGNKLQSVSETGNANVILKCDLSDLTDNGNGTYTPSIIQTKIIRWVGMFQGGKYYNGRLYIGFSNTSSPYKSRIAVIDPYTGEIKTIVDMTAVTTSECEGLCYRITDTNILWLYTDYWNVYQLKFFS